MICAFHDVGLSVDRENHGVESAKIFLGDKFLRKYFSDDEMKLMAEAIEDHRSKYLGNRRSIYGKVLAEADRESAYNAARGVERLWGYRLTHMPNSTDKEKFDDMMDWIEKLYAPCGKFSTSELEIPILKKKMAETAKILRDTKEVMKYKP